MNQHYHHWDDGRGPRRVMVNGNEIDGVMWADLKRGVVEFCPHPVRLRKDGTIYKRRLRGRVEVELMDDRNGPA